MKKFNIPAPFVVAGVTLLAVAAFAAAVLLLAASPAQAAEQPNAGASGRVVVYTIKQFSLDGKPLGEWKTRYARPIVSAGGCVEWRVSRDFPSNEVCGGVTQVTAEEETMLTHQKP